MISCCQYGFKTFNISLLLNVVKTKTYGITKPMM